MRNFIYRKMALLWDHICHVLIAILLCIDLTWKPWVIHLRSCVGKSLEMISSGKVSKVFIETIFGILEQSANGGLAGLLSNNTIQGFLMSTFWGTLKKTWNWCNMDIHHQEVRYYRSRIFLKYFQCYFHNIISFHLRSVVYRHGFVTCLPVFLLACLERVGKKKKKN